MKTITLSFIVALLLGTKLESCEKAGASVVPACIQETIRQIQSEPVTNPASSVWQYTYKGKTVYFIPSICCDIPSRLIDTECKLICNPDGGFTGKGEGK